MKNLDGKDLMQELIKSWGVVDRKEKYEFRLRVAKRKNVFISEPAITNYVEDKQVEEEKK